MTDEELKKAKDILAGFMSARGEEIPKCPGCGERIAYSQEFCEKCRPVKDADQS